MGRLLVCLPVTPVVNNERLLRSSASVSSGAGRMDASIAERIAERIAGGIFPVHLAKSSVAHTSSLQRAELSCDLLLLQLTPPASPERTFGHAPPPVWHPNSSCNDSIPSRIVYCSSVEGSDPARFKSLSHTITVLTTRQVCSALASERASEQATNRGKHHRVDVRLIPVND